MLADQLCAGIGYVQPSANKRTEGTCHFPVVLAGFRGFRDLASEVDCLKQGNNYSNPDLMVVGVICVIQCLLQRLLYLLTRLFGLACHSITGQLARMPALLLRRK